MLATGGPEVDPHLSGVIGDVRAEELDCEVVVGEGGWAGALQVTVIQNWAETTMMNTQGTLN